MNELQVTNVLELLSGSEHDALEELLGAQHSADVALVVNEVSEISVKDAWRLLELFPRRRQAEIFGYLQPPTQVILARAVSRSRLAAVVSRMSADERVDLFNRLSTEQQEALLPALAQVERDEIRRLAGYEEGTAGAVMTSDYATLSPEVTARDAIERLRREAPDKETIYQAYVVDAERRLVGIVSLRDLILAPATARIEELMTTELVTGAVYEDQEEIAAKIAHYDLMSLPIVDARGTMVGIVTHDDAIDVLQEEATEDFHRVATVGHLPVNVEQAGLRALYKSRISWLVLLVFANIFSGAGIAAFEETIEAHVALVFFLPLLIDSAGNAGSQSATLMVRALATGQVIMRDWWKMVAREFSVAGALGLTMAFAVSWLGFWRGGPEIGLVVSMTMIIVVLVGSVIGVSMPFLLNRFGRDPATASAPLITSICDISGVLIYFGIASVVLGLPGVG